MAIKFILNKEHIAYIDEQLLENYREIMQIPTERKNSRVLRDIMYKDILETEFYSDEADKKIKELQDRVQHHKFKNAGEFIEFYMHKAIEKKLDICQNCHMFHEGYCARYDARVAKSLPSCNSKKAKISSKEASSWKIMINQLVEEGKMSQEEANKRITEIVKLSEKEK